MATLTRSRRASSERGAELIEFALVFPMLLLVMLGIVDFGFLFQRYEVVTNAAREGARVAILAGYDEDDVEARVQQFLTASGLTGTPVTTVYPAAGVDVGGKCITLTGARVDYPHNFLFLAPIVSFFGGSGFVSKTISATSMMRFEGTALPCP
jgi:hypothetical protein